MKRKYRTLISNTLLISLGTFGSKLLVFFMVRFYTGYLTPEDYGTADLITQTANLLIPLISLGVTEGVFRFAIDRRYGKKSVFSAGIYTITLGCLLFLPALPLLRLVPEFSGHIWLIILFTVEACYHTLCAQYIRALGNTALYAVQGMINTALVIGMNILFLAVFSWGVTGYVLSVVLADFLCTVFLVVHQRLWRRLTFHPRGAVWGQMLRYSIPLIPTTIFWWITSVSDRYMVNAFIGSAANGIYAVSYKLPTILTLVSSVFMEAWQFSAVTEAEGDRRAHIRFYSRVWCSFQRVMFLAGALIIAFSQLEIQILAADSYYEAWRYVPLLSAAMVFAAFDTFMGSVYLVKKRSGLSFWTAMAGAGVNLVLNFLLIPTKMGIQGAALATLVSYIVVFFVRLRTARRLIPFRLYAGRVGTSSVILLIQIVFILWQLPLWQLVQAICICILVVQIDPVILWRHWRARRK